MRSPGSLLTRFSTGTTESLPSGARCAGNALAAAHDYSCTSASTRASSPTVAACRRCFCLAQCLVKHWRIHNGERPYKGGDCTKCFSQRANLVPHGRVHVGEKPCKWRDCARSFSRSSRLIPHQRAHAGERPGGWGRLRQEPQQMLAHRRVHLGEKP
ncbi:zinc finger protein 79-like [Eubalaena glacialis]|uniref:zinc finger protein 79-like n=1 Tax=Eubalaena glacialis TaxID=27606 RepID=UPI002A5B0440|nr:zinc finger protein 79-like [Eubalaena glacialis]